MSIFDPNTGNEAEDEMAKALGCVVCFIGAVIVLIGGLIWKVLF